MKNLTQVRIAGIRLTMTDEEIEERCNYGIRILPLMLKIKQRGDTKMKAHLGCDMEKNFCHIARDGIDIMVNTKSGHKIIMGVREHGMRLKVDDVEQTDLDFDIKKA